LGELRRSLGGAWEELRRSSGGAQEELGRRTVQVGSTVLNLERSLGCLWDKKISVQGDIRIKVYLSKQLSVTAERRKSSSLIIASFPRKQKASMKAVQCSLARCKKDQYAELAQMIPLAPLVAL